MILVPVSAQLPPPANQRPARAALPSGPAASSGTPLGPVQQQISNWERDLVAERSAARETVEGKRDARTFMTLGAAALGAGLLFVGAPYAGIAVLFAGILVSPPMKP